MQKKKPLKKSMSGEELEFFVLNNKGQMVNDADKLINLAKKKYPEVTVECEAGQSMIETSSFASVNVLHTLIELLENIKKLIDVADQNEYILYPNATYPGTVKPQITNKKWYQDQIKLFNEDRALNASLVCGFHYHYTLPRGVFDHKKKFLKDVKNSKLARALVDSYNLSVAFDPALTTLLASSPYVQGRYIGKDSRVIIYRGGKKLDYMKGKYSIHQSLGALPPYKQTLNDLKFSLAQRQKKWKEMMEKKGLNPSKVVNKTNILDFTWNPVRVNKLGTLELRGMDMNHPKYTMAMASLLKFVFRKIYRDFYTVLPSDVGLSEPFKIEGNVIHIPPHTHVRNVLQNKAAYKGFDNKEVLNYTKRFYRFSRQFLDDNYTEVVKPLYELIDNEESISDKILKSAKKKGYGKDDKLPNSVARELALEGAERLLKEVDETEAKLYKAYNITPSDKSESKV